MGIAKSVAVAAGAALATTFVAGGALFFYYVYAPRPKPPASRGKIVSRDLDVDSRTRTTLIYVPPSLPRGAPLVLALHGSESEPAHMRDATGYELERLADQHGFAVAYPAGIGGAWNDCRRVAPFEAKRLNIDDVGFLKGVIDMMHISHGIARDRVYALGFSNGAQMVFRMMLCAPDALAGAATFGGNLPEDANMMCPKEGPTPPIMLVSGTADPIVPFGGGDASLFGLASRGIVLSAEETFATFAGLNGLDPADATTETLPHRHADDPTRVHVRAIAKGGRPYVVLYTVDGGGHVVPQPKVPMPRMLGAVTGDLNGPAAAIDFFLYADAKAA